MQLITKEYNVKKELAYKRPLDIVSASIGLVVFSPILLATAFAVKLDDMGPAIYKQERLTKNGRIFNIYKFRSMRTDTAKDEMTAMHEEDDERVTGAGRYLRKSHLDELPQLWNVLKGDMSVVGPRPELPELTELYCKDIPEFRQRLQIKAGLTGYAQVYCRNNDDPAEKIKYDIEYMDKMSLLTDLKIVLATLKLLLGKIFPLK